jgi:phosphatidylinositol glycan class W
MAKDYKQLKMEHVSGLTGSSLFDINSVSLAMPVPYTTHTRACPWC